MTLGMTLDVRQSIRVVDTVRAGAWVTPSASIINGIALIWRSLDTLIKDWDRDVSIRWPDDARHDDELSAAFLAADELRPRFAMCLFGYITFFFMMEDGYDRLYQDMDALNGSLGLGLPHGKRPSRPAYRATLKLIRNHSIAHWGGSGSGKRGSEPNARLNAAAGQSLGYHYPVDSSGRADLRAMQFGAVGVISRDTRTGVETHSDSRITLPLAQTHEICSRYHAEYDAVCADYLAALKARMPMTVGSREYS